MRNRIFSALALLTLVAVGLASAGDAAKVVVWPASAIAWSDSPAMKGAKVAVLWGDPTKAAYGALKKLPAGGALALHTHPFEHKVVTVSGTITLTVEGSAAKEMGPGSYALIPAGVKHKGECGSGADCVYLEESPGKFDIEFVK